MRGGPASGSNSYYTTTRVITTFFLLGNKTISHFFFTSRTLVCWRNIFLLRINLQFTSSKEDPRYDRSILQFRVYLNVYFQFRSKRKSCAFCLHNLSVFQSYQFNLDGKILSLWKKAVKLKFHVVTWSKYDGKFVLTFFKAHF